MSELRILLADDHSIVREGLKKIITDNPGMTVIAEASDGEAACREAVKLQPDIVILDISMPNRNGIDAASCIRDSCPNTKILALTIHEDIEYYERLVQVGVSGYMLKRASGREIIRAIDAIAEGKKYLDPEISAKVMARAIRQSTMPAVKLSTRESEVLQLIAKGNTNRNIALIMFLSEKSVETYKARAMSKLGLRDKTDIVRYAVEQGWLKFS